jgi:hypothetical protein
VQSKQHEIEVSQGRRTAKKNRKEGEEPATNTEERTREEENNIKKNGKEEATVEVDFYRGCPRMKKKNYSRVP